MIRVERIQHKFLLWLNAHSAHRSQSLDYIDLLHHFSMISLSSRRVQYDILFARNVLRCRIDSPFLLEVFALSVPARVTRQRMLMHVQHSRVDTIKKGLFSRLPVEMNKFLIRFPVSDVFNDSFGHFKSSVCAYVAELGSIL